MKYFSKNKYSGNHQPDYVASSVAEINFDTLQKLGVRCVAFDIDGTLTKNGSGSINTTLAKLVKDKLDKTGIKTRFLASNSKRSLDDIAEILGAFEIHQPSGVKGKPSRLYYDQLVQKSGYKSNEIAMIGDRLLQDTWGANKAGLVTVLVALNPEYATFRDKVIGRHWWQPIFVRNKK
jgi:HAD superfamily phosphatase (TIGR01668 family)